MMYSQGASISIDTSFDEEKTALFAACEEGDAEAVKAYLTDPDSLYDVNKYCDGMSPLHAAVLSSKNSGEDIVNTLLDHKADINAQTIVKRNTALHLLVLNGDFPRQFDSLVVFLSRNADLSIRNRSLRTAYDCALADGHLELAAVLSGSIPPDQAKKVYQQRLSQKYGPYILDAVIKSNQKNLETAIKYGGDPNYTNKYGAAAIHYAVTKSKLPVYETLTSLLDAGADPNLRDHEGDSALNLVIKTSRLRSSDQMVKCVRLLVQWDARSNIKDLDGNDAVELAEDRQYGDVLDILIGPRPESKPPSPVLSDIPEVKEEERAVSPEEVKEAMLEVGGAQIDDDSTPQREINENSASNEDDNTVNIPDSEGYFPLHRAVQLANEIDRNEKVKALIQKGALVNAVIKSTGNTALHLCANKDYGSTAEILLDNNIDYKIKNNQGRTAYTISIPKSSTGNQVKKAILAKMNSDRARANWQRGAKKASSCSIL